MSVEEAIEIMKELLVSHDDRLEDYYKALEQSRHDFEFKMNALVDSQIKTEIELKELKQSVGEVKQSIIELRTNSEIANRRLERLENKNGGN